MTSVRVDIRQAPDVVVATLSGDIDLAGTPSVATQVLTAVSNATAGLVVNLSAVRYLDSAGIQMLFELARRLEAGRQGMALVVGEASPLRTLLDMTGIKQAVSVCGNDDDAIAAAKLGAIRRY